MKIFASLIAVAGLLVLASAAQAGLVATFDGSAGYATFMDEYAAYRAFMGTPQDTITFDDIGQSDQPVGNHYASKGVTFSNEGVVRLLAASGGGYAGWQQGDVAGYTNPPTYDSVGGILYNKISNADPNSQLTIMYFDHPVQQVGSFVSNSAYPAPATMSTEVRAYNSAGNLLAVVTAVTRQWIEYPNPGDNIEGFWGIKCDGRDIAKITFLAPTPPPTYADVTTLDNIEWVVPEPATMAFLAVGGVGLLLRRRRR